MEGSGEETWCLTIVGAHPLLDCAKDGAPSSSCGLSRSIRLWRDGSGEFADAGEFEDGALAAFGGFECDEAAAGRDVFVGERIEFCGRSVDFDGFYWVGVDGEIGVEFDG